MRRILAFAVLGVLFAATAHAQSIGLSLSFRNNRIAFSVTARSASSCSLRLIGAETLRGVSDNSGAEIFVTSSARRRVQLTSTTLDRLRTTRPVRIYFRAVLSCSGRTIRSPARSITLPRSNSGIRSPRLWVEHIIERTFASAYRLVEVPQADSFAQIIDVQDADDGSQRLFIAQQNGQIFVLDRAAPQPTPSVFLSLGSRTVASGEQGLLGMTFHPDYAENGQFFTHYTRASDGANVISRWTRTSSTVANPASEEILLTIDQPFTNHNGGQIAFGTDGFLYISIGDGGGGGDTLGNGQNLMTLLGKLLRIDVNSTEADRQYAIPPTNPFFSGGTARREIYAYGLRNMWRFSFDPVSRRGFGADVGQNAREEVNLIRSGANYGWNRLEGSICYQDGCSSSGTVLPIAEYPHSVGRSITGGYMYRGRFTPLRGVYLYGDFITGVLFGLRIRGSERVVTRLTDTDLNISTFGRTRSGEVLIADYGGGIYSLQSRQ